MANFSLMEKIIVNSICSTVGLYDLLGGLEIENQQALEALSDGGVILSNHVSNFDPPLVGYSMFTGLRNSNQAHCIAKMGMKDFSIFKNANHVLPVMRGKDKKKLILSGVYENRAVADLAAGIYNAETMSNACSLINSGDVLLLFPQGTRKSVSSEVIFKKSAVEPWTNGVSKSLVLTNIGYLGLKTKITHSEPINFTCVDEILTESQKFYSSFRK